MPPKMRKPKPFPSRHRPRFNMLSRGTASHLRSTNFGCMNRLCRADLPSLWTTAVLRRAKIDVKKISANHPQMLAWENKDYVLGSAAVGDHGRILVAIPLPQSFA